MMFKKIVPILFSVLFILTALAAFVFANQLSIVEKLVHKEMAMQELSVKLSDIFHKQEWDIEELDIFLKAGPGKPRYVFIYITFGLTCPACRESITEFAQEINRRGDYIDYFEIQCGEKTSANSNIVAYEPNILKWKGYQFSQALVVYDRHSRQVLSVDFPDQPFYSIDYTLLWRDYIKSVVNN